MIRIRRMTSAVFVWPMGLLAPPRASSVEIGVSASLRGAMAGPTKKMTLGERLLWVYKMVRNFFEPSGGLDVSAVADYDPAYLAQRLKSICSACDQPTNVDLLNLGDKLQTLEGQGSTSSIMRGGCEPSVGTD